MCSSGDQEVSRDDLLDSMFRSELMTKCRFFIPPEAAYGSIGELGELGCVQFIDLNPEAASFQRQFTSDVKRCEEVEQKLRSGVLMLN